MTLSRMHLGMLGVVSIFTGIISPVVGDAGASFPFPLTDLQIPAYLILFSLAIICILLAVRSWSWARFFCLLVLGLLGYLFVQTWNGEVHTTGGMVVRTLSWGWIFLFSGAALLITSMFDDQDSDTIPTLSDHLIGWLGAIAILALTGLIISISYIPGIRQNNKTHIIEGVLGSGSTETYSGVTRSRAYPSIERLVFDRKKDSLSFFTASGTSMVGVPSGAVFDRLPYATTSIGGSLYTVSAE